LKNKKLTYTVEEAKKRLERYCSYQDRCHKEVEQKLYEMRMIPEACELILLHLMDKDFLNEERYAKSFARGKFKIKSWGKKRIILELKQRKISKYNIDTALKEIDEDEYHNKIKFLAVKKYELLSEPNAFKKRQKLIDFLLRKGFENYLVYDVVREITQNVK
jgi:regulatory protein